MLSLRPIPESYWVEPGIFLAGEYPGRFPPELTRQRLDAFLQAGFSAFIDLTCPGELPPYEALLREEAGYYNIQPGYWRFGIGDYGLPDSQTMRQILDTLEQTTQNGQKTYLHCWGGIGRTGTAVGCYLRKRGLSGEQALGQLATWWQDVPKARLHPRTPETGAQMDFVRTYNP